jgi:hypothetical protein
LFTSAANALIAAMAAFLVGGSFVAMALNDLTWLTFALVAALDRVSAAACAEADGVSRECDGTLRRGIDPWQEPTRGIA